MKRALILVDIQNDFMPSGSLPVAHGDDVVPVANEMQRHFDLIVATQDWHPADHGSFASNHPGCKPGDMTELGGLPQVLWPDHCVQNTPGAALHKDLNVPHAELIIRKGYRKQIDSYSAFLEADRKTHTGLAGYLKERGLRNVYLVGLATDFCVGWSAIDARKAGLAATVIEDGCRGIDASGSLAKAWSDMKIAGVRRIRSADLQV